MYFPVEQRLCQTTLFQKKVTCVELLRASCGWGSINYVSQIKQKEKKEELRPQRPRWKKKKRSLKWLQWNIKSLFNISNLTNPLGWSKNIVYLRKTRFARTDSFLKHSKDETFSKYFTGWKKPQTCHSVYYYCIMYTSVHEPSPYHWEVEQCGANIELNIWQ